MNFKKITLLLLLFIISVGVTSAAEPSENIGTETNIIPTDMVETTILLII